MTSPLSRAGSALAAVAISLATLPLQALAAIPFTDVPAGNEFYGYIDSLYNAGVISGVTPTTFEPTRTMTRGEVAKVVVKAKGMPLNTAGAPHFSDVTIGSSFYSYVETLFNAGVVAGYGNGTYGVNNPVTRGEFSKIVAKAYMIPVDLTGAPHFSDVPASNGFYAFIETLRANGIISGYANGTFGPNNFVLRQEVAKMADRTMKLAKTTGFNAGTGARLDVESTADQIVANCYSTTSITVTAYDKFGSVDESFTDNVTVKTTLGKFSGSTLDQETKKATTGRASFTLTSCTAGSANVTGSATSYSPTTIEVRFTQTAQGPNEGKGPVCTTGTGCMDASVISDKLLPAVNAEAGVATDVRAFLGGEALVQVYLYDSNGDTLNLGNSAIRCTIISGTGAFLAPANFLGTPAGAEVRSLFLTNEGNGRYIAKYSVVTNQIPGTAKFECTDLLASPALTTTLTVDLKPITVKTWVADSTLLAAGPLLGEPAYSGQQATTAWFATLTDQYGDPRTLNCDATNPMTLQGRVIGGPSDSVITALSGAADRLSAVGATGGSGDTYLQGLYAAEVLAGATPGTATLEARADLCIGQPRATTTLTIAEPKLELFASSMSIGGPIDGVSNATRIFARITDPNGKPLTGETLNIVQESGPPINPLTSPLAPVGAADGFYETPLSLVAIPTVAQPLVLRVTDPNRIGTGSQPLQATITIQTNPSNSRGTGATLTLIPLRTTVGPTQTVPFLAMVRDSRQSGVAVNCAPFAPPVAPVSPGTMSVNTMVGTTAAIAQTGGGTDGACFYNVTFANTVGNVRLQVQYQAVAQPPALPTYNGLMLVQEISFDVRDRTVKLEPINTRLTFGDGSGSIVYVRDEVGDSVSLLAPGAFNNQISDTRIMPLPGVPVAVELATTGSYSYTFHIPEGVAASNFTVRTTLQTPAAVTNPTDSFSVTASAPTVTVKAHPGSLITGRCMVIDAIVRSASGAPLTNGSLTFEIASATGGNGTLTANNTGACAVGARQVTLVTDNGTIMNDGVYVVTYQASAIASTDTIRAYLPDIATTPEGTVSVTSR